MLEKLIRKRVFCFLDKNETLYNNQYGFRNNHSATQAVIDITEKNKKYFK